MIACTLLALFAHTCLLSAAPAVLPVAQLDVAVVAARAVGLTPYQPVSTSCPTTPLVRPATGLNSQEASYVASRKAKANTALAAWLSKQGKFSTNSQPVLGLTSSGGGYRALLEGAGVVQGFDGRDSTAKVSGLYQGLTYESGLSGGAWFLSSLTGNNWPTVSYLRDNLWEQAFQNSLLLPANLLSANGLTEYAVITSDITSKQAAGYDVTVVDPYGRLLSYQLLQGPDGGVATYMSTLATLSNFTNYNVPYPVITALGALLSKGQCNPPLNATQYEFGPYEFGSWDTGVSAFTHTKYLGSNLNNGKPVQANACTVQYDNLGYVLGTSSDVFPAACEAVPASNSSSAPLVQVLEGFVSAAKDPAVEDTYALYRNPFFNYTRSSLVKNDQELTLADGGLAGQSRSPTHVQLSHPSTDHCLRQPDLAFHPTSPHNRCPHRQRQLSRHVRQLSQRHRNPPNLPERPSRWAQKNALYPRRSNLRVPRPQQARHLLRLQRDRHDFHRLPAECSLHVPVWTAD